MGYGSLPSLPPVHSTYLGNRLWLASLTTTRGFYLLSSQAMARFARYQLWDLLSKFPGYGSLRSLLPVESTYLVPRLWLALLASTCGFYSGYGSLRSLPLVDFTHVLDLECSRKF